MKTIRIKLYKFNELSQTSKDQAIVDHVKFLIETMDENSVFWPAVEKMQTPWFLSETLYHDYKKEIIEEIEANDYDFKADGSIY